MQQDNQQDDLSYIERCAKQATKGEWMAVGSWVENTKDNLPDIVCAPHDLDRGPRDNLKQRENDALYIAAVQPVVVLELIEHVRALRALL